MVQTSVEVRQQNPDETEKMAQYESPDGEDICASYISRKVAEQLGEFATIDVSDEANVMAGLQKTTSSYAVFETPGGSVTGLYLSKDLFDGEAPESVGLTLSESDEESFEEEVEAIEEAEEEEVDGLLADSDESDEEEVEISDEELNIVDE